MTFLPQIIFVLLFITSMRVAYVSGNRDRSIANLVVAQAKLTAKICKQHPNIELYAHELYQHKYSDWMYQTMCPSLLTMFPTCNNICPVISMYEMVIFENVFKTKIYTANNFPITYLQNAHLNIHAGDIWDFYTKFCDLSLSIGDSNKIKQRKIMHSNRILNKIIAIAILIYIIFVFCFIVFLMIISIIPSLHYYFFAR